LPASKTPTSSSWKAETRNPTHKELELGALLPQESNEGNLFLFSKKKWEVKKGKRVKRFPSEEFPRSISINSCKKESIDVNI
jgi:hypothetical protein